MRNRQVWKRFVFRGTLGKRPMIHRRLTVDSTVGIYMGAIGGMHTICQQKQLSVLIFQKSDTHLNSWFLIFLLKRKYYCPIKESAPFRFIVDLPLGLKVGDALTSTFILKPQDINAPCHRDSGITGAQCLLVLVHSTFWGRYPLLA